MYTSNRNILQE